MNPNVLLIFIVMFVFFGYYTMNLFLPSHKKLKYFISLSFFIIGLLSWIFVWLGNGWLITGIVGSAFLILSALSLVIALGLDLFVYAKSSQLKPK